MRVSSLSARDIKNAGADRQPQQLDEPRNLGACSLGGKQRAVLEQVVGVKGGLPPLGAFLQKNTGSRYAPKTDSIAARIS